MRDRLLQREGAADERNVTVAREVFIAPRLAVNEKQPAVTTEVYAP